MQADASRKESASRRSRRSHKFVEVLKVGPARRSRPRGPRSRFLQCRTTTSRSAGLQARLSTSTEAAEQPAEWRKLALAWMAALHLGAADERPEAPLFQAALDLRTSASIGTKPVIKWVQSGVERLSGNWASRLAASSTAATDWGSCRRRSRPSWGRGRGQRAPHGRCPRAEVSPGKAQSQLRRLVPSTPPRRR